MSNPRFPDPLRIREPLAPGATAPLGGLTLEQRVAALEQGAAAKERPILYYAGLYLDIAGAPTHNSSGAWQNVADGGGTDAWTAICDIRPSGVSAHLDTDANDGTITIRKTGVYSISYSTGFAYQADQAVIGAGIQINSGDPTKLAAATRISGAGICRIYRHQFETLTSGDVLSLSAFQASGGASAYTSGATRDNYMAIAYIGPSA